MTAADHQPPPPRIIGRWGGPGPTLVVVASLHGNEPAGYQAALRVRHRFDAAPPGLRGGLLMVLGNRVALARGTRYVDQDLNRIWSDRLLARLSAGEPCAGEPAEYAEAAELFDAVLPSLDSGPTFVLDLHTASGDSPPFAVLADTLRNRAFARSLALPIILGLEERLDGTFLSHLETLGFITTGCEGGRHDDPAAVDHLEAVVWLALAGSGVLADPQAVAEVGRSRAHLRLAAGREPRVLEVRHRHAVRPDDRFRMDAGFASFRPVRAGQPVARDRTGVVTVPASGHLLLPLYQDQGSDGFFLMRRVRPFWLAVSAALRRLGAPALAHWLPGVRRDPERPGVLVVDRRTARWLALDIFHLLGFRRQREEGDRLEMSRRPDR